MLASRPAAAAFIRAFYSAPVSSHDEDGTCKWTTHLSVSFPRSQSHHCIDACFPVVITGVAELSIGILVMCMARFRPLVRKYVPASWLSAFREKPQHDEQEQHILTIGHHRAPRLHGPLYMATCAIEKDNKGSSKLPNEISSKRLKSPYQSPRF